jgi:hypothetical protein
VNGPLVAFASHRHFGADGMILQLGLPVFVLFRPGEPGVYMRVSYYLDFINSIMNRGDQIR